jgi:transcriptional regulator of acetoin/glycerol metabolism
MPLYTIPSPETLQQEIVASHQRCRQFKIDPNQVINTRQRKLRPRELELRLMHNQEFLDIATDHIQQLYHYVAGAGFAVTLTDSEGYILHSVGDQPLLDRMAKGNCCPGFRWTEEEVGTSVISLALARQIPVQIHDEEHYCQRGHGFTCSASPVFDPDKHLLGVIAMSGPVSKVHPHTLGMVITVTRAIEKEIKYQKASMELRVRNNYMRSIINSIDSGVMTIDREGFIREVNNYGRRIFDWIDPLEGTPLEKLLGRQVDLQKIMEPGHEIIDREMFIQGSQKRYKVLSTVKPIFDALDKMHGYILVFHEITRIHKIVHAMAGTQARFSFDDIIGTGKAVSESKKLATSAAGRKSTVLLLGETGTGKELFAQAIHNESPRSEFPFLALNCGAIPKELLESELFGYAEGAFTGAKKGGRPGKFELADHGTLFLDEIGDMPTDMQVKLLRVLQTGEVCRVGGDFPVSVDVRIIAATNADLKRKVEQGNFREDLFYRLNVFPISIPALRERKEDIPLLARYILSRLMRNADTLLSFAPEAEACLAAYPWPGNVREMENVIERAVNLSDDSVIRAADLHLPSTPRIKIDVKQDQGSYLEEVEKQAIFEVLQGVEFNMSKASKKLGISRSTLYKKVVRYQLSSS